MPHRRASPATWSSSELVGSRKGVGINALLSSEKGATRLIDTLSPVTLPVECAPVDPDLADLEARMEATREALVAARLRLVASADDHPDLYALSLQSPAPPSGRAA